MTEPDRNHLQQAARDVGRRIREHLDAQALIGEAVRGLGEALDLDRVYVRLMDGDRLGAIEREWCGPGVTPVRDDLRTPRGYADLIQRLHNTGTSLVINDAAAGFDHPAWPGFIAATGAKALVVTPLSAGSELLGALYLMTVASTRTWTPAELQLIDNVTADTARGYRHAQLYQAQAEIVLQLREIDRVKDEFVSMVSHELRTPLTSIAGYVELLADGAAGPLNPGQQHMLSVVARNTEQLRSLIEDLLTLSQIESGQYRLRQAPVDLGAIMARVCAGVLLEPASDPQFDYHACAEPLIVNGDESQLERLLANLIGNAVKFTPADGRVTVSALRRGDDAVLTVADTGMGIPENEVDNVFIRFFRASNATRQAVQGTGLGLAIVRMIVEQHGGQVSLKSALERGTTVTVRIPLVLADVPADVAVATAGNTAVRAGVEMTVSSSGTLTRGSGSRGAESLDSPPRPGGPSN